MRTPICPTCHAIHVAGDVVTAGSRFTATGPDGYRPHSGGTVRATRAEVQADLCGLRVTERYLGESA